MSEKIKRIFINGGLYSEISDMSTLGEVELFYRQCLMLRVPRCIRDIRKEEKLDAEQVSRTQNMRYAGIDFSEADVPVLSPEQFRENIVEILHLIRSRS